MPVCAIAAKTPGLASRPRAVPYYGVSDAIPAMHVSLSGVAERIQVSQSCAVTAMPLMVFHA